MFAAGIGRQQHMEYFNPVVMRPLCVPNVIRGNAAARAAYFSRLKREANGLLVAVIHWEQYADFLDNAEGADLLRGGHFLYMSRDDRRAQALSFHVAMETGCWDGEPAKSLSQYPRLWRRDLLAERRDGVEWLSSKWPSWFHERGIRPVRLSYEKLVEDIPEAVRLVASMVGFAVPANFHYHEPPPRRDPARDQLKALAY